MSLHIGGSWDPLVRIKELVNNLRILSSIPDGGTTIFSTFDFIRPVSILPIASYAFDHSITIQNANSYLDSIEFPEGTNTSKFNKIGQTYVPITKANLKSASRDGREKKLRFYLTITQNYCGGILTIKSFLTELVTMYYIFLFPKWLII